MNDLLKMLIEIIGLLKSSKCAEKEVLTFDEAVMYTGFTKSYLYKLTSTKQIPHSKPHGKLIFFNRKEIEFWLQSNKIQTDEESQSKALEYCRTHKKGSTDGNKGTRL